MVIDNFNVFGTVSSPEEAHPPLIIDTNAVLAIPVPFKGVKTIARRRAQVSQLFGRIQCRQLTFRHRLDVCPPACLARGKERLLWPKVVSRDRQESLRCDAYIQD